jgi:ATP-dependent RNA helicase DDX46/PRP5
VLQTDRESTISDFKGGVCSVLVATSVAARGLDVRDLALVINYDTPNHLEEYVHRCGRTGRAGNKGTAITFLSWEDDQYAPDLVKALKDSKAAVPRDLQARATHVKLHTAPALQLPSHQTLRSGKSSALLQLSPFS